MKSFTIPFNRPACTGIEEHYVLAAMRSDHLSGDGSYGHVCESWMESRFNCKRVLLTPSCTHALELAAMLVDIRAGDEVIMPSYTFVSTANAFVLRGATVVFVDIRPDTMNLDEALVEAAITPRTKIIVPVHYAGIACEMEAIMDIADRYGLFVVEDAAQGIMSTYGDRPLGTIGHFGTYSFHETKNLTSGGEGGALIINDSRFIERAEIIREKGTNRRQFFRGMVDKYSWVDIGSSYLPSELQSAYLWGQLDNADQITEERRASWRRYRTGLRALEDNGVIHTPVVPPSCEHNGHIFYLKVENLDIRTRLLAHLSEEGIHATSHYVPLHTAPGGRCFGRFHGVERFTSRESDRLIRLPMFYGIKPEEIRRVVESIHAFFRLR